MTIPERPSWLDLTASDIKAIDAKQSATFPACAMHHDTTSDEAIHTHFQLDRLDDAGLAATIGRLRSCAAGGHALARTHAELFQAQLSLRQGDTLQALRDLSAARQAITECPEPQGLTALHLTAARVYLGSAAPADALAELDIARPLADQVADLRLRTLCALLYMASFHDLAQPDAMAPWRERAKCLAHEGGYMEVELQCLLEEAGQWLEIAAEAAASENVQLAAAQALVLCDKAQPWLKYSETPARMKQDHGERRSRALSLLGRKEEALSGFEEGLALLAIIPALDLELKVRNGRASILRDMGQLAAAAEECRLGIAAARAAGRDRGRDALHQLASQIAERQHDLPAAVDHMKQLLAVREALADEAAKVRSAVTSARLQTDRAMALAIAERERSTQLLLDNLALRQRAEAFERDAQQDPLTGAANRRQFDARLAAAHAAAALRRTPLCVALLDIDHFKRVNDVHGHPMGDLVLQRLVHLLRAHCREGDWVARLGGEEFAITFDGIDLGRAQAACERIRQAVQDAAWHEMAAGLAVTTSIGVADVALLPTPAEGLAAADALLYQAKNSGRNRVASLGVTPA